MLQHRPVELESRAVGHKCQRQAPSHDIEENEIGAVLVVRTALVEDLVGDLLAIENDHVVSHDIEVNNIGFCRS